MKKRCALAEDEGFEPSVGHPTHAFQACALGRYANPPLWLQDKKEYRQICSDLLINPPVGFLWLILTLSLSSEITDK